MSHKDTQTTSKLTNITSTSRRSEIENMISSKSNISMTDKNENLTRYLQQIDDEEYERYPGTETDTYDFSSERHGYYKMNFIESTAHLIKGTLGAGVLTMHEAFMNGGLWTSLIFTLFFGFLNYYSMYMLSTSAQTMYRRLRVSKLSYPDLAEAAAAKGAWLSFRKFSKLFRFIVDLSLVLFMSGTCCIYQIMMASTFKEAVETMDSDAAYGHANNVRTYIVMSFPILMLLCLIRKIKFLTMFSIVSDVFIMLCVLATLYYSLKTGEELSDRPAWKNVDGFIKFCGLNIYSTCGIAVCLPVENNMKLPLNFPYALCWSSWTVVIFTAVTGFFGYWGWGETCTSPIIIHMPTNVFTILLQFLVTIMLCITFVVVFWVPFRILWYYIRQMKKFRSYSDKSLATWERLYRTLLVFLVTCVSLAFPNLIPFMVFLSCFFLGFIAFVFPAFIESLITWKEDRDNFIRWRSLKNILLIAFGLILSPSAFYFFTI